MKANSFLELPILRSLFYKGMCKTLVEESNGWVSEHYFKVVEEDRKVLLEVYKPNEPIDNLKNPQILVDVRNISEKTKTMLLRWRRDEDYAYPIFSEQNFGDRLVTNADMEDVYRLGISLRDLLETDRPQEKKDNKLMVILIVFALILGVVNIAILIQVAEKAGVVLL